MLISPDTFVCDAEADRQRWLDERRKVVTGTGLGVLLGYNPWEDPDALILRYKEERERGYSRFMWWGTQMEVPNLKAYEAITGDKCAPYHGFHVRGHIGSTLDGLTLLSDDGGLLVDPNHVCNAPTFLENFSYDLQALYEEHGPGPYPLEMKNTDDRKVSEWGREGPPKHYWCQAQAQAYVTDAPACILVGKLGHANIRCHVIWRNDFFLEEEALPAAEEFMEKLNDH
jgi:hypothetical protein